jgi:phosphoserine phosphatase
VKLPEIQKPKVKLVSFDLDGTILKGHILEHLRIPMKLHNEIMAQDELFFQGQLTYEQTLEIQFRMLAGLKAAEIAPDVNDLPLIGDLERTLEKFDEAGATAVVLTDNPSFAAEPLRKCGFQKIIGSEIQASRGFLTHKMRLLRNKFDGLRLYCERNRLQVISCAHVGDWVNDIPVFEKTAVSVAFNWDEKEVSEAATYSVRSDSLLDVYRVLEPHLPFS